MVESPIDSGMRKDYDLPDSLQWALYLTVRGDIPKDFPLYDASYTYAIERWSEVRDLVHLDADFDTSRPLKEHLRRRVNTLGTEAETYLAKLHGTYDQLTEQRKFRRFLGTKISSLKGEGPTFFAAICKGQGFLVPAPTKEVALSLIVESLWEVLERKIPRSLIRSSVNVISTPVPDSILKQLEVPHAVG